MTKNSITTSNQPVNTSSSVSTKDNCAWCNAEQGKSQGEGSHGICTPHEQRMLDAAHERRVARGGR